MPMKLSLLFDNWFNAVSKWQVFSYIFFAWLPWYMNVLHNGHLCYRQRKTLCYLLHIVVAIKSRGDGMLFWINISRNDAGSMHGWGNNFWNFWKVRARIHMVMSWWFGLYMNPSPWRETFNHFMESVPIRYRDHFQWLFRLNELAKAL